MPFALFVARSSYPTNTTTTKAEMNWNGYFSSLRGYLEFYRQEDQRATGFSGGRAPMPEKEIEGLASYTQLAISIAKRVIIFTSALPFIS